MTRKRSAYRPRSVMSNPLSLMQPASEEQKAAVLRRFLTALDAMANCQHPGENEWRDLSDAVNTVETLALTLRKLEPAEVMPTVNAAIAGMVGAANRFRAGLGMRLDGAGLEALRDVIDFYRQCLDGLTEREMALAQAMTQERMYRLLHQKHHSPEVIAL